MKLSQHFSQAIANITSAKLRSFLAVLGIMVGTASVVALVTSGELATQKALNQFKALGTDLLAVTLFQKQSNKPASPANTMTLGEWWQLKDEFDDIVELAPYSVVYQDVSFEGHKLKGVIIGANESLTDVIKIDLQSGNFVSYLENYEQFCVIGNNIEQQIKQYTLDSPIGKKLWLGKHVYQIIGVAKPWSENAFFNENINSAVIIPLAGTAIISKNSKINNVVLKLSAQSGNNIEPLIENIKSFIKRHAPELSVFTRSAKQIIKSMQSQGQIFTLLLGLIGGISLLVGGIGVMNVMLVSVTERKREIGIRKAIGAKRRDIQRLFLIESVVLSLFGGLLGVITGIIVSYVIAYFSHWDFEFFFMPPVIGFAVSVVTGVFFGFYPAMRAAKLDPIETLRYD